MSDSEEIKFFLRFHSRVIVIIEDIFHYWLYITFIIYFNLFFLFFFFHLWTCVFAGTPVNRIPIMAKQVLDLYMLYKLVTEKGGLVEVINKKLWREITKGLNLPTSITSAAFTLRTQSVPIHSFFFSFIWLAARSATTDLQQSTRSLFIGQIWLLSCCIRNPNRSGLRT